MDPKVPKNGQSQADALEERLIDFAVRIVTLSAHLPRTPAGKHIAGQIMRSGTLPRLTMVRQEAPKAMQISFTSYESF